MMLNLGIKFQTSCQYIGKIINLSLEEKTLDEKRNICSLLSISKFISGYMELGFKHDFYNLQQHLS